MPCACMGAFCLAFIHPFNAMTCGLRCCAASTDSDSRARDEGSIQVLSHGGGGGSVVCEAKETCGCGFVRAQAQCDGCVGSFGLFGGLKTQR